MNSNFYDYLISFSSKNYSSLKIDIYPSKYQVNLILPNTELLWRKFQAPRTYILEIKPFKYVFKILYSEKTITFGGVILQDRHSYIFMIYKRERIHSKGRKTYDRYLKIASLLK